MLSSSKGAISIHSIISNVPSKFEVALAAGVAEDNCGIIVKTCFYIPMRQFT